MQVARLPTRPSDLLAMREAGHTAEERLAFDLMCVGFDDAFAREQEATKDVTAPRTSARRGTIRVPKHDQATLLGYLGIDPGAVAAAAQSDAAAALGKGDPDVMDLAEDILSGRVDWFALVGAGGDG